MATITPEKLRRVDREATRQFLLRELTALCQADLPAGEFFAEFLGPVLSRHHGRQLREEQNTSNQRQQFIQLVHESLDARQTAYTIANETKRLLDCDRVSVAIRRGKKCRVEAVSGQDTLDKRSNVVTLLGRLATRVAATGRPLWFEGTADELPPQIESALHDYVGQSHVKTISVVPLIDRRGSQADVDDDARRDRRNQRVTGTLVIEQIEDTLAREQIEPRVEFVRPHAEQALANALAHSNLFLMPLWRTLGRSANLFRGRLLPKTLAVLAIALIGVFSLLVVPADFDLEAKGTLQPAEKHEVFARVKGVVRTLHVQSGQMVQRGQLLMELENPELAALIADKEGQWQAASTQLRSVTYRRLRVDDLTDTERLQLAGERDRLTKLIESLAEQLRLLKQQQAHLQVFSPLDGQVVTWDLDKLLSSRPVTEGQRLLTIARPDGAWELELHMPDKRMGHLEDARAALDDGERLPVTFVLATEPDVTRRGWVAESQPTAELHESEGHSVRLRVALDDSGASPVIANPRTGAEVIGNVYCGRRPLGYVWFHEGYEAVQRFLFSKF